MAFGYDGSIRIDTHINSTGFLRGIGDINRGFDGMNTSLKKLGGMIATVFGAAAIIKFGRDSIKAASDLSNAWLGLGSIVEGQGKSFSRAKSFINDYISDGLVPLENAVTAYKNLASRGYSTEEIEKVMIALKDSAAFGRQSSYTLGEAIQSAAEGLKNENSILVDNAGVTKNVYKMWEDYAKSIGTTVNKLTQQQKIQAEVNGIMEETKFQVGDAAKLAGTYSGQLAMLSFNFQQLKVAVGEALIPIAQAILPSINAIIAALVKLANMFAKVTALLFGKSTKVVATGQKEIASTGAAAAGSADKLADSLGKTGSAAKKAGEEMETALAPFDEFNILAFSASKNAGGSGGGGGAGGEFDPGIPDVDDTIDDYEAVQEEFETLADLFVKMLEDMLKAMPRFKQALLDFADAFNEMNQKLYDAFKDPRILPLVKELGRQLADALNALTDAIDWNLWGRTLGAGLNLGLQFLNEVLYGYDWINLGRKLADFINGLVSEIDWYEFGRLLWAGFKIALETLAGFIVDLDMPLLAKAASDTIKGFFDEMKNTIERIPWGEIGTQIATFLNEIDWYGSITSVLAAISAAFNALRDLIANFVSTMNWSDIAKQIYTAINDSMGQVDWKGLGQALGDLFINAFNFLREIIAGIDWFQIGKDIAEFMNGIDWGELAEAIFDALAEAINAGLELLAGFISEADPDSIVAAFGIFFGLLFGNKIMKSVKKHIKDFAKLIVTELSDKLALAFTAVKAGALSLSQVLDVVFGPASTIVKIAGVVGGAIIALKSFRDMLENGFNWLNEALMGIGIAIAAVSAILLGAPAAVVGVVAGIVTALATLVVAWDDIKQAAIDFADKIIECGENIGLGFLKGIGEGIKNLVDLVDKHIFRPVIDTLKKLFGIHSPSTVMAEIGENVVAGFIQGIKETWNGILEFFSGGVEKIKEFFSGAWDSVKEKTSESWNSIKETVSGIWESIQERSGEIFENIKEKIVTAWEGLKEKTSAAWEGIKTNLTTLWDSLKTKVTEVFDGIQEKVSTIWDNIKEKTSTIWESIKSTLTTAWENLKTAAKEKFENIKTAIATAWENVKAKTTEIWNNIKTTLSTLWNELKTNVTTIFTEIKNKVVEVWTNIKNEAVSKWTEIKSTISEKISNIKETVTDGFTRVKETITSKVTEAIDALKNKDWASVGRGIVDGIANGLNGIFDKLRSWASRVWDSVSSAFDGGGRSSGSSRRSSSRTVSYSDYRLTPAAMTGYSVRPLPKLANGAVIPPMPKLANGAVIPPNQQFMAILDDQRSGTNIEAPLGTIEKALQNVLDRNGGMGNGGGPLEIKLMVDKKVLARVVVPEINDMTRSAGKPVLLM